MDGGRKKHPDHPKVLNQGIYLKSYSGSLYNLGHIPQLRPFGRSGHTQTKMNKIEEPWSAAGGRRTAVLKA